jgi:hypothetical protein
VPDCFGEPVVILLVCLFVFAREAAGAQNTRHSLRPLYDRGAITMQNSGIMCRENAGGHPWWAISGEQVVLDALRAARKLSKAF